MKTIGANIDAIHDLREKKRALEKQVKDLEQEISTLSTDLMAQMDAAGVQRSTGGKATVSISLNVRPNVTDWDAFYAYIHRTKYYHLLERRPAVAGCNELLETKKAIPGVVPYTNRSLNIRSI